MKLQLDIGYPKHRLYQNAEICIPDHGVVSFLGDNGSGKSTVYKTLMGMIDPLKGTVPSEIQSNIAVVSDYVHLPNEVRIRNILRLLGESRTLAARQNYPDLYERVEHLAQQKIKTLSSGQKRIVEIFCALAAGKRIIILDEAANALDFASKRLFLEQTKQLSEKIVFLHTSHDLEDAVFLGGTVYGLFQNDRQIKEYAGEISLAGLKQFLSYGVII